MKDNYHIGVETKWLPFGRGHFQIVRKGPIDYKLALVRILAWHWTVVSSSGGGLVYLRIYHDICASLRLDELKFIAPGPQYIPKSFIFLDNWRGNVILSWFLFTAYCDSSKLYSEQTNTTT